MVVASIQRSRIPKIVPGDLGACRHDEYGIAPCQKIGLDRFSDLEKWLTVLCLNTIKGCTGGEVSSLTLVKVAAVAAAGERTCFADIPLSRESV